MFVGNMFSAAVSPDFRSVPWVQGLTVVHFSAQRKQVSVGEGVYLGMI